MDWSKKAVSIMQENPLVSVIVPVYNTGRYVGACLDSICGQTYRNLEILVVDDGSMDDSSVVIGKNLNDLRVKVIHRSNGGLSAARNTGLESATGEFIAFVDSDDTIQPAMIETLLGLLCLNQADFSRCDLRSVALAEEIEVLPPPEGVLSKVLDSPVEDFVRCGFFPSVCHVMFRRKSIGGMRFTPGIYFEDMDFMFRFLRCVERGVYIQWTGYNYRLSPGSIIRGGREMKKIFDYNKVIRNLFDEYALHGDSRLSLLRKSVFVGACKQIIKIGRKARKCKDLELAHFSNLLVASLLRDGIVRFGDFSPAWYFRNLCALWDYVKSGSPRYDVISQMLSERIM